MTEIRTTYPNWSWSALKGIVPHSRQAYHKALKAKQARSRTSEEVDTLVHEWRERHPKMGSRALYYSMKNGGNQIPMGVNAFEHLMARQGLTIQRPKRFVPKASDGRGRNGYDNLANGLILNNINQLVVSDITYIYVKNLWHYLFVLKDVYSQRLISLVPSRNMKATNVYQTLLDLEALRGKAALKNCIHHSDNGSQYEAQKVIECMSDLGIKISRAENCIENGSSEQMHHLIKNTYIIPKNPQSFEQLVQLCQQTVVLMNQQRAVKQLGYRTVQQFEEYIHTLKPSERPQKQLHQF